MTHRHATVPNVGGVYSTLRYPKATFPAFVIGRHVKTVSLVPTAQPYRDRSKGASLRRNADIPRGVSYGFRPVRTYHQVKNFEVIFPT